MQTIEIQGLVVAADFEFFKQMLVRLKKMTAKYRVRDCSEFLAKARLMMNRKAPWNKGIVHWTPVVVGSMNIQRTFDTTPLDIYMEAEANAAAVAAYCVPVESVA
jgi:hypothetical protein